MNVPMTHTGRCLCGAVRVEVRDRRAEFGICHCGMCQRWAGSMLAAVSCPEATVTVAGAEAVGTYRSSDWAERSWCTRCGTTLWYRITAEGAHKGEYEIPVGLFDDHAGLTLEREIFVDRAAGCFTIAGNHQRLTEAEVFAIYGIDSTGA